MKKVLVVEDDHDLGRIIVKYLNKEGYLGLWVSSGAEALEQLRKDNCHLIILDVQLPGIDGIELCGKIRESHNIPILFLSAKNKEDDKIKGLEVGGDDYMVKPFSPRELMARVRSHLVRYERIKLDSESSLMLEFRDLRIELAMQRVWVGDELVFLSTKEYQLLAFLAQQPNAVFSTDQLFEVIWDAPSLSEPGTVSVHIHNLRKKIEPNSGKPIYIITVRGTGYSFCANPDKAAPQMGAKV
jgi:DNA-binding response OmpR family regulator